ncbi:MAG: hypothetical protein KatS3mg032_2092 [Cyclobacteriaceae bacterium]|nr:MAG: hypothetical protein KatS3mg032_2092 [Cyclobacteriaceae bacterium]
MTVLNVVLFFVLLMQDKEYKTVTYGRYNLHFRYEFVADSAIIVVQRKPSQVVAGCPAIAQGGLNLRPAPPPVNNRYAESYVYALLAQGVGVKLVKTVIAACKAK